MSEAQIIQKTLVATTIVGEFLAKRGLLVMKEFRDIRKIKSEAGSTLSVTTVVLSVAQSINAERSYGLKFSHTNEDCFAESCLLDFDELSELAKAVDFILRTAIETAGHNVDYTEFIYSTKDSFQVGFYRMPNGGTQQAFCVVRPGGETMFLEFSQLRQISEAVKTAHEHLAASGAIP